MRALVGTSQAEAIYFSKKDLRARRSILYLLVSETYTLHKTFISYNQTETQKDCAFAFVSQKVQIHTDEKYIGWEHPTTKD